VEQFCDPHSGEVLGLLGSDYIENIDNSDAKSELRLLKKEREAQLFSGHLETYRKAITSLPLKKAEHLIFDQKVVTIGAKEELDATQSECLDNALKAFIPWKKGPFNIFGTEIDSEWRSDLKWERIKPHVSLSGKRVADIGCHNGYFMFRMAAENPELVVGIEPVPKHWFNFQMLQRFTQLPNLHFELLGVEHMHLWPGFFDTIFCLGILYHHTDPISMLRKIHKAMKPGAELIIDCQGIIGDDPIALMPKGRYAKARGIWWLPTKTALANWLSRTMFKDIECFYDEPLEPTEQRTSTWAPIDSLSEFLDPSDSSLTIEGYPAPRRFYVKCRK